MIKFNALYDDPVDVPEEPQADGPGGTQPPPPPIKPPQS